MKGVGKSKWSKMSVALLISVFIMAPMVLTAQALARGKMKGSDVDRFALPKAPELGREDGGICLHLASGTFDPLLEPLVIPAMPQVTMESIPPGESAYYLVQLDGPITDEQKEDLTEAGAQIFDYIPEFAFIVKMDDDTRTVVETYDCVRWVGVYQPGYRVEPKLIRELNLSASSRSIELIVVTFRGEDVNRIADQLRALGGRTLDITSTKWKGKIKVAIEFAKIAQIAAVMGVKWVEEAPVWKLFNDVARGIMDVHPVWSPNNLFGQGQVVGIADSGLDQGSTAPGSLHDDFEDGSENSRVLQIIERAGDGASSDVNSGHGTHVAGSVLGNGLMSGSNPSSHDYAASYAGVAPEAQLIFQAIEDNSSGDLTGIPSDLNVLFDQARTAGAHMHTNSWGSDVAGYYTSSSEDVDENSWDNKNFTILFSAGNAGVDSNADGIIDLYSLDEPATAKNCITVGASENNRPTGSSPSPGYDGPWGAESWAVLYPAEPIFSDHLSNNSEGMAAFSSRGPCLDGRTKPDVVAPGTNIVSTLSSQVSPPDLWGSGGLSGGLEDYYVFSGGTSMSTPLVAGSAALVREYYTDRGVTPSSALIKATLINGAADMSGQYAGSEVVDGPRPNQAEGWGRVDLQNSLFPTSPRRMTYWDVTPGLITSQPNTYNIQVVDDTEPLRVSLVWTDYPGSPAAGGGLVNDLDLSVVDPLATTHYPNGASQRGQTEVIQYDDDLWDYAWYWEPGYQVGVRFTPTSYPSKLDKASLLLYSDSYPKTFNYYVYDGSDATGPQNVLGSGATTIREMGWHIVDLSGFNITVTSGDFFVAIELPDYDLVWFTDGTSPDGRSWDYTGTWDKYPYEDYMFRAVVTSTAYSTSFDRVNNVVGVDIDTPMMGVYTINVEGFNVPQGPQPYALVISGGIEIEGGAPVDFDGDGETDIGIYRSSTGAWWIIPSSTGSAYGVGWGGPGFIPVLGDYDGDGKADVAVYQESAGAWWIIPSSTGSGYGVGWGVSGYIPVPSDYDGDGKTDVAIYGESTGAWWIIPSSTGSAYGVGWGGSGYIPVPFDYDGDGKADIAIYGESTGVWWIIPSSTGSGYGVGWGGTGYVPVPFDYDGDGKADIAIYGVSTGAWWIIPSSTGSGYGVGWGGPGFVPVPGDYDGDGKADVAIYHESTGGWWIIPSSTGSAYGVGWGGDPSDVPLNLIAIGWYYY
jgi:hypothetical protein